MASQSLPGHAHPLTFGVEFEFLVARRADPDPHPQDRRRTVPFGTLPVGNSNGNSANERAQDLVKSLLASNGIPALSGHRYGLSNIAYVQNEKNLQGVQPPPNQVAIHAFWVVSDDPTIKMIQGEDIEDYEYEDLEVASRILQESNFNEVERVYALIQNNIRTQVNSSCGLHYHIGISHLSLESIKKLVTLLIVVEGKGLFRRTCAQHRSSQTNRRWCQPVSELSRAAMERDSPPGGRVHPSLEYHLPYSHDISHDLLLTLSRIWDCGSVEEIVDQTLTCNYAAAGAASGFNRRGGFAVRKPEVELNIEGALVNTDPTIEFRYKESTGSALEDYHWLQLCLQLVRVAERPAGGFRAMMGICSATDTLEGLLGGLGVGGNEVQWWLGIAERHHHHPGLVKKTRFLEPENVSSSGVA